MLHLTLMMVALAPTHQQKSDDLSDAFRTASRVAYDRAVAGLTGNRRPSETAPVMVDTTSFRRVAVEQGSNSGALKNLLQEFGSKASATPAADMLDCTADRSRCSTRGGGLGIELTGMTRQDSTLTLDVRVTFTDRRPNTTALATGFEVWRVTLIRRGNAYTVAEAALRMAS